MALPIVMVNYAAIFVASIVALIISFIWFGPIFGKTWMKIKGITPKQAAAGKKDMPKNMIAYFIGLLVMNFVLAHFLGYVGATNISEALMTGALLWLGFIATVLFAGMLWEKMPSKLFAINLFHYLVVLLVSSGIIVTMSTRMIIVP